MQDHNRTLCQLSDIPDNSGRGYSVSLPGAPHRVDIVVVRRGVLVKAYRNVCPHKGLNLEWMTNRFMDPTGEYLQCANHGALFRIEDGYCVSGPCAGARLKAVAVRVDPNGDVALDTSEV
jgi:nitrite reductase/ring-hydroxylating ferredoxin subunit